MVHREPRIRRGTGGGWCVSKPHRDDARRSKDEMRRVMEEEVKRFDGGRREGGVGERKAV